MKKILLLMLVMLPLLASATVEIDGLYYNLDSDAKTAEVTSNSNGYSGAVIIPSNVIYDGVDYSVTSISDDAFTGCSGLTSVTIPNSVTSLGVGAFSGCSSLTSMIVESGNATYDSRENCNAIIKTASNILIAGCKNTVIPNSVTRIGGIAFEGCSGLTSVTIPSSVMSIGEGAFGGCSGLTSVTIPNSMTSIGRCAFINCFALTSATIPNSVTAIGEMAFSGCYNLTSIIVESGNTTYDSRNNCNAIIETANNILIAGCKNTVIPNNVTSIGDFAFWNIRDLTSVIIPNNVTNIGNKAFFGCSGLTSVTIPNGVTSIGESAFYHCIELTSVTVLNPTPVAISEDVFSNRANATLYIPNGSKEVYQAADNWKDFKEIVEISNPSSIIGFADANVKALCVANWDINGDGELDQEEAAAVTDLGSVFRYNSNITSFNELQYFTGLTSIGNHSFRVCSNLTSITIPNSVTNIGIYSFYCCSGLSSITISSSVTSIGEYAFNGCRSLTSVTIPSSVTSIGICAFANCSSLTSIVVESGNTKYNSRDNCNAIIETETNTLETGCKNTVIPSSVTSIGDFAFSGCSGLTSITIPNSVTSIGDFAFSGCSGLTSITIPNSVTRIGGIAFLDCSGLISVIVELGNATYDSRDNCNAIIETDSDKLIAGCKNTVIPNSVTSIGRYAFCGCSGLTSITIPNSITIIGEMAFSDCFGLNFITISESVTSIGDSAFRNCSGLTSVTIGKSMTNVGDYAFYGCDGLTSFTVLNPTPIAISENVFTNQMNATLYVPKGSKEAYLTADYWKEFKEIVEMPSSLIEFVDDNVKAICVANWDTNSDGELDLEEAAAVTDLGNVFNSNSDITSFDELQYFTGLTSIGGFSFRYCSGLTSVTIPHSVISIGEYAFAWCSGLTSVTIPNSVMSIGDRAFQACSGLTSIIVELGNATYDSRDNCNAIIETGSNKLIAGCKNTIIPNSVTSIGYEAFYNCSGITSITIPNGVTSIGWHAFAWCSGLTSVTIPNSVTNIGNYAFQACSGLTSIVVESGNATYDSRDNCNAIIESESNTLLCGSKNTVIPNSVTSIGSYAFEYCFGLTSITIPNSVTSIGNQAFAYCSLLTTITIPNSVTSIGSSAFRGCDSLTSIIVESRNAMYDSRDNCNAIIETSSNTLIVGCMNTFISNSVTNIGDCAFDGCSGLTSITIPNSVTSIGYEAFYNCSGLTSVTALNPSPVTIAEDVFSNRANATLYVPKGCKDAYQAAEYWKQFKEIVEIETSGIEQIMGSENGKAMIFTIDGKRVDNLKKGLNVIRMKDGTIRKTVVK